MTEPPTDPAATTHLLGWLRDRDVPCPLCGYNLRGLTSPRCPECGQELRLSVALADPFNVAWLTATVACCAAGGAGAFLLCVIVGEDRLPPVSAPCGASMVGFVLAIPFAVASIRLRRPFQRLSRRRQAAVAAGAVTVAVANTVLSVFTVR